MAIMRFNFLSEALSLCVDVTITYPAGLFTYSADPSKKEMGARQKKKIPYKNGMKLQTVYILHGGSDDDTLPLRYTNLERYAERNCVMTVSAQVKDSFYIDTAYGFKYFTFMTEELPVVVRSLFASSPERGNNFVIGFAMGGNGALALAMKRPDLYSAVVDLSGGIGCSLDTDYFFEQMEQLKLPRLQSAFGDLEKFRESEFDLGYYARKNIAQKIDMPKLFLAVGENDFIRDVVRKDRDVLRSLGYDFKYEEAPGYGHDWDFWDTYFEKALDDWLPLKRAPIFA
jgi:putative tributyrin esterase